MVLKVNAVQEFFKFATSAKIIRGAFGISLFVGTALNMINQGEFIASGAGIQWGRFILNYFVPFGVATYSAARNEMAKNNRRC